MKIVWDEPKRLANIDKHGIDFEQIGRFDWIAARVIPARSGRLQAIGRLDGQVVSVIFRALGTEAISIISVRTANTEERSLL